jgi:hypothetical protein
MRETLKELLRYVDTHHRRATRTQGENHLPPEQLLADCLNVRKTRPVLESGKPVSRYHGVNLGSRSLLHLWIEGESDEEGGHRGHGLSCVLNVEETRRTRRRTVSTPADACDQQFIPSYQIERFTLKHRAQHSFDDILLYTVLGTIEHLYLQELFTCQG